MDESTGVVDDVAEGPSLGDLLQQTTQSTVVTKSLLTLNIGYFLLMAVAGVSLVSPTTGELVAFGANFGPFTLNGQGYRLFSSTFIHIGLLHLAFNMWCLLNLGSLAERIYGNGFFATIYILAGLGGSITSVWWNPNIVSAGASGAIFGIAGALVAFFYLETDPVLKRVVSEARKSMLFFVGFNLVFGFTNSGIDNGAHLGGLVVGLAMGALLRRPLGANRPSLPARFLSTSIGVSFVLMMVFRHAETRAQSQPHVVATAGEILAAQGEWDDAIEHYHRALEIDPDLALIHFNLALAYEAKQMDAEAVSALRRAIEIEPESSLFHNQLAWRYATTENDRVKDPRLALTHAEKAVEIEGGAVPPHILDTLAEAYYVNARFDEAIEIERRAVEMAPDTPIFHEQLAKYERAKMENPSVSPP